MVLRTNPPVPILVAVIELIDEDYVGVRFPYDPRVVAQLRRLNSRRWNAEKKRWEVHIAHLAELMGILRIPPTEVPAAALRRYQSHWVKPAARLRVGNSIVQFEGGHLPIDRLDQATSFPEARHELNRRFLDGTWDGLRHLLDRRAQTVPTGLLERVLDVLRADNVPFRIEDIREEMAQPATPSIDPTRAGPTASEAVMKVFEARRGIVEIARRREVWRMVPTIVSAFPQSEIVVLVHGEECRVRGVNVLREALGAPVGSAGRDGVALRRVSVVEVELAAAALGVAAPDAPATEGADPSAALQSGAIDRALKAEVADALARKLREAAIVLAKDVHLAPVGVLHDVVMQCESAAWRLGFSTVPPQTAENAFLLEAAFGPVVFRSDVGDQLDRKLAVPCRLGMVAHTEFPPCERDRDRGDILRRAVLTNASRHAHVAAESLRIARETDGAGKVVVVAHDAAHASAISEAARLPASVVFCTNEDDRALDDTGIAAFVLADGSSSAGKCLERVLRAMTAAGDRSHVVGVDFLDPVPYLKRDGWRRAELYRSQRGIELAVSETHRA